MFASSLDEDQNRETRIITEMLRRRVDALILTTVRRNQSHLVKEQERGTVLVFVDRAPTGIVADTVVTDNFEGAEAAVAHLLQHGHTKIAYLGDDAHLWTAQERLRGFRAKLAAHSIDPPPASVIQDLHDEEPPGSLRASCWTPPTRRPPSSRLRTWSRSARSAPCANAACSTRSR